MNEWVRIAGDGGYWFISFGREASWRLSQRRRCDSVAADPRASIHRGVSRARRHAGGAALTAFMLASELSSATFVSGSALLDAGPSIAARAREMEVFRAAQGVLATTARVSTIEAYFPLVVSVWLAGVAVLLLRTFRGWYQIRRLHKAALGWAPSLWQLPANRLAQRLRLQTSVRVVEFTAVDVPTVLGWLRPVIILPVAAVAQLPPGQVEAVLAHELAHVRRHDYLVESSSESGGSSSLLSSCDLVDLRPGSRRTRALLR